MSNTETNTAATINALGKRQRNVLAALARHGSWNGSGWVWENYSTTKTVLTSLIKTGLVEMVDTSTPTQTSSWHYAQPARTKQPQGRWHKHRPLAAYASRPVRRRNLAGHSEHLTQERLNQ